MPGTELNGWWRIGLFFAAPLTRSLFRVRVEGVERVPLRGPAILAFDHVSVLDGPVLAIVTGRRVRRPTRFLVAAEVFDRRVAGWILRRYSQIPVRRGERDEGALDEVIGTVRSGVLTAIAPEGRVSHDPSTGLQRVRSGVARIALPTGAPVIPVGIWGTQDRWPQSGLRWSRPWRPHIGISFGALILPAADVDDPGAVDSLMVRVRDALEGELFHAQALANGR